MFVGVYPEGETPRSRDVDAARLAAKAVVEVDLRGGHVPHGEPDGQTAPPRGILCCGWRTSQVDYTWHRRQLRCGPRGADPGAAVVSPGDERPQVLVQLSHGTLGALRAQYGPDPSQFLGGQRGPGGDG